MRIVKSSARCLLVGVALASTFGVASASAEPLVPWWGIESIQRPSSIKAGLAKNEVQQLVVTETPAIIEITVDGSLVGVFATEPYAKLFGAPEPTAANLQTALESPAAYGPGNVTVTGGPAGTGPFTITTVKGAGDQPVAPVETNGSAETKVLVEGAYDGQLVVNVQNRGDGIADGSVSPVVVTDTLPKGLSAVGVKGESGTGSQGGGSSASSLCTVAPGGASVSCEFTGSVPAYQGIEVQVYVVVEGGAISGEENRVSVSGGGASATATASHAVSVNEQPSFGIEEYRLVPEEANGAVATQAGSHPFQLTTVISLNQRLEHLESASYGQFPMPVRLPKDLTAQWPAGMVGNPTPFPQCTDEQFSKGLRLPSGEELPNECAADTAVGVASVTIDEPLTLRLRTFNVPLFNLVPTAGEPARFGFLPVTPVFLDVGVRTGGDYGLTITAHDTTELVGFLSARITVWGVPGDPRHDSQRGWECLLGLTTSCSVGAGAPPPFLLMPTSCELPFSSQMEADSWPAPGEPAVNAKPLSFSLPESLDGCNRLPFEPSATVQPDVPEGSTPTGVAVGVHVSQTAIMAPKGLAESALDDTTVTLPEGVTVNPGGADSLEACSEAQVGFEGVEAGSGRDLFSSDRGSCPDASKIGTLEIETPLLPHALKGAAYLATQNANPFGSLLAMYLIAEDPVSGSLLKLPGEVLLNPVTGRLVSTFKHTPEIPFENLRLHFFGGDRAPLSTPSLCGSYTTGTVFAPWSGNPPVETSSTFDITSGPSHAACADPLPFGPELTTGSLNIQAGAFTPFTMTMSREDGNQNLEGIKLQMPPGLLGEISKTKLCGETEANAGTCGPESLIGETTVSVGLGGNPYTVKGGKVYITGPYAGAPYGLSIVNPAKAGPFDLGQVVVRAKIEVDPTTAAITITSDTSGPHKIPQLIDGIPLEIKHVNVTITRPEFTFNPTNCEPMQIGGALTSTEGSVSILHVPFQVTNCATLGFKPVFSVSTSGKTSRANGASLHVKLMYPKAAQGTQANIKSVHVELPKALPSRLSTLNHACLDSVFNQNPSNCPAQSRVGFAKAITPVLPVPLEGPAYFVSHGGQKFPELIFVLQGYGVTVYLEGETFISTAGITSSTFKSVPDVPVGTFELTLPQGPFSALAANRNLCTTGLAMPTKMTGQNGAIVEQKTQIAVTGCKPAIQVLSHKVKGGSAMLVVHVPSAGTLVATGSAVKRSVKRVGKAGNVTIAVTLTGPDLRVLAKHSGQHINAKVTLRFSPKHGESLTAHVKLLLG